MATVVPPVFPLHRGGVPPASLSHDGPRTGAIIFIAFFPSLLTHALSLS